MSAATASKRRWIISPWCDSLFLIGAALPIGVAFLIAQSVGAAGLALFVLYVMATGHHLPGFVRIATDPELFQRFRWRFTVIPLAVVAIAFLFDRQQLHALVFVTFLWGVWHGMMQVYGFARIYDAKQGEVSSLTARFDWWLCAVWFLTLVLGSAFYAEDLRIRAADAGSSFLSEMLLSPVSQQLLWGGAIATTLAYVAYTIWAWAHGHRISVLKIALLGCSLSLFFVSYRLLAADKLVGLALWEAFHDVQYYAIVWAYNRRRGERAGLSRWGRALFRPSLWCIGLYLLAICAYGSLDFGSRLSQGTLDWLRPLLVSSAFLHFYFDGFIWKIRQSNVQQDLAIPSGTAATKSLAAAPRFGLGDLCRQGAWIAAPLVVLVMLEAGTSSWDLPACELVSATLPGTAESDCNLARLYARDGRWGDAAGQYAHALTRDPESLTARAGLGRSLARLGLVDEARESLRIACASGSAGEDVVAELALLEWQTDRHADALQTLESAVSAQPQSARLLTMLSTFLTTCPRRELRDPSRALQHAERGLAIADVEHRPEVLDALAAAHASLGNFSAAVEKTREAARLAELRGDARRTEALRRMLRIYEQRLVTQNAPPGGPLPGQN